MIHREDILEYNAETVDLSKRGVSEWSLPAEATVPGDPWAPSAPTISAAAADQAIDLTLTRPATNVDGTTCTDFKEFRVYYSASPGININTPSTYDGTFYTASTSPLPLISSRLQSIGITTSPVHHRKLARRQPRKQPLRP